MKAKDILKHYSIIAQDERVIGIYKTVQKKFNLKDILNTSSARYLYGHEGDIEIGSDIFCLLVDRSFIKDMYASENRGILSMREAALWQLTSYGLETLRYELPNNKIAYIYKLD